ncbi:MAG: AAA family ATPase [Clostridiales bacterium]|nr:AAA family ATPase [Clostridiales bacterium]
MLLNNGKKRIPIGYEDFKEIIDGKFYYVDKTMLIYHLLCNGGKNNLITRPRRFGKTLNFSMLRYFFDITEKDNACLFDDLKISGYYDELAMYRNTHPVISLSLKCAKQGDYAKAIYSLRYEIQEQFKKYRYVWESELVDRNDRDKAEAVMQPDSNEEILSQSIKLLSLCLKQYYGVNTIILIDEYDVPLEDAYFSGYYDEMVRFIRSLFESALKTNPALEFSVITGCLRISKESIFTGLNNLEVNSILSDTYSESFGFVQSEVDELLRYYDIEEKRQEMKEWYDGYLFGKSEVYNPWSVLNQAKTWTRDTEAFAVTWWANTSSNNIIKTLVGQSDDETKAAVELLIHGGSVETTLKETVTYGDLTESNENIWSFLFFTGYLKIKSVKKVGTKALYSLVIPNLEIHDCYTDIIMQYFNAYKRAINKDELYTALIGRDAAGFADPITKLLKSSISFYDNTESFYHGLVSGLLVGNIYYKAESNRETGNGRSDLILYQNDRFINAIIMEFKVCRADEEVDAVAKRALRQIDDRDYASEARNRGYRNIIKYGVAFKDKVCYAVVE